MLPEPEALDQMMLLSTGSGVAQPLSPPATGCQALRGIWPPPKPDGQRSAWPTIRRIILFVAVDEVGNSIVDGDVIHLRDRKLNAVPGLAARN